MGELETGDTANLRYTIKIDSNTTAGNYELLLPVNYEYQAKTETLRLPVSVKSEPMFEITSVSGDLKQGETGIIEVTYGNVREEVAKDATARIIVMSPLSTPNSVVRLGDIDQERTGLPDSRFRQNPMPL